MISKKFNGEYMVNPNKIVKRDSNDIFIITPELDNDGSAKARNLENFIKTNYRYMYKSMDDNEFPFYDDEEYYLYVEIVYEHKVVGFMAFNIDEKNLFLYNCYIMPEYRGKGLLVKALEVSGERFGKGICLFNPNRKIINAMINSDRVIRINDRIIMTTHSMITVLEPFDRSVNDVSPTFIDLKGKKARSTNVYDLDLCATVCINNKNVIYTGQEDDSSDLCCMNVSREDDNTEYGCVSKRQNDSWINDKSYFEEINSLILEFKENNDDEDILII